MEALVRWEHPTRGLRPPSEFIPVAEENGLIVQLGQWVLEAACRQARIWQTQYPEHSGLVIAVNLSGRQFTQPNLADMVAQTLKATGLDPRCLELEITESIALGSTEATVATLRS